MTNIINHNPFADKSPMASTVLVFLWLTTNTYADTMDCSLRIPKTLDWTFAQVLYQSDQRPEDKIQTINKSCLELDVTSDSGSFVQTPVDMLQELFTLATDIFDSGANVRSSFAVLKDDGNQKMYKAELEKIKSIQNPVLRIQKTYELAVRYQGKYDERTDGSLGGGPVQRGPIQVLDHAEKTGVGGVCSDFASLLHWSLLQVARPANSKTRYGELDENSFSVNMAKGCGRRPSEDKSSCHQWVRVHLPRRNDQNKLEFGHFDLDTTWYPERFTPLMPRFLNLEDDKLKSLNATCLQIQNCLRDQAIESYQRGVGVSANTNPKKAKQLSPIPRSKR